MRTSKGDKDLSIYTFNQALQRKRDKFAKMYPDLCRQTVETKEGSKTYEIEMTRFGTRLLLLLLEEKRKMLSEE